MALTDKQQAFINEYLLCWNATRAAIKAGYSEKTARAIGSENLTKPDIMIEIKRRVEELTMSTDEALIRLSAQARTTMEDFLDILPGARIPIMNWQKALESGALQSVKEITFKDGEISFKLYDTQSAIAQILKQRQLLEGKPTEIIDDASLTDIERANRIATLLESARTRRDRSADNDGQSG